MSGAGPSRATFGSRATRSAGETADDRADVGSRSPSESVLSPSDGSVREACTTRHGSKQGRKRLASESVTSEGGSYVVDGSSGEAGTRLPKRSARATNEVLREWTARLWGTDKWEGDEQKTQLGKTSATGEHSNRPADSSIDELPRCPQFPTGGSTDDIRKWHKECAKVRKAHAKVAKNNLLSGRFRKYKGSSEAVQDRTYQKAILAAARSIVSVTPISKENEARRPQCTGFIIKKFQSSGSSFAIIVTCSKVVCKEGRKLHDPPKLSVGFPNKMFVEGRLLYFNDHYDIAFLLLPIKSPLVLPRFGSHLDYKEEVFLLGRDEEAFLGVRHGVVSWKEESDFMGRNYYMFLNGEIPEGGTGGPVIDHSGIFRGMAFYASPKPAVLSMPTILTCFKMFVQFGYVPRPMLGLGLRTISSLCLELQECIFDHGIKSGFIVDMVKYNSPAESLGIYEGNVILSVNGRKNMTLPKLEDFVLSRGWDHLDPSVTTVHLELEVCDLNGCTKSITLPLKLCFSSERVWPSHG